LKWDQSPGCYLGKYLLKNLDVYWALQVTKPLPPWLMPHPTQVFKTGTKRLSQKSNTRRILIEMATKYWFLLNVINVVSREKDRPQGLRVQIYISWVTYNHIELREVPLQNEKVPA
jgi:hypothetical protein